MTLNGKTRNGFGLVELILYVAILSLIAGSLIQVTWAMVYGQKKSENQQELYWNLKFVSQKISDEIKRATSITVVNNNQLMITSMDNTRNPIQIVFSNGAIKMGVGAVGSCSIVSMCDLTSNGVEVTGASFVDLSSADLKSRNININLEMRTKGDREEYIISNSILTSVEVRGE